jgi:NADH:ubiquinone oxidoreductase subunit 6 (subunit J)
VVQTFAFYSISAIVILGAIGVMVLKNVFRAALSLILCLIGIAGIFILLNADFLAGAQILIYVGAISVIIILAVMLTSEFTQVNESNRLRIPAIAVAGIFLGFVSYFMLRTHWQISTEKPIEPTTPALAQQLFGYNGYILPLEITSVLILVVIISAIVIAREKD